MLRNFVVGSSILDAFGETDCTSAVHREQTKSAPHKQPAVRATHRAWLYRRRLGTRWGGCVQMPAPSTKTAGSCALALLGSIPHTRILTVGRESASRPLSALGKSGGPARDGCWFCPGALLSTSSEGKSLSPHSNHSSLQLPIPASALRSIPSTRYAQDMSRLPSHHTADTSWEAVCRYDVEPSVYKVLVPRAQGFDPCHSLIWW